MEGSCVWGTGENDSSIVLELILLYYEKKKEKKSMSKETRLL